MKSTNTVLAGVAVVATVLALGGCSTGTEQAAQSSTATSTEKRAFSMELAAKCFTHAMAWRCTPRVSAAPSSPTWKGSSP